MGDLTTIWRDAADVIGERGWVQGELENEDGVCLTGALKVCSPQPGDWLIARAVARHRDRGEDWNDAEGRTKNQVTFWLRRTKPIVDAELAVVFGPQWEQVVALVRRAAVLTDDEADRLAAARYAARTARGDAIWDVARYAAQSAAWDAAWDAARYAAQSAARDAAWDATWDAVGAATKALAVRDLIGRHGFTQAHYDTLTRPWRQVIGPVHPDDKELT